MSAPRIDLTDTRQCDAALDYCNGCISREQLDAELAWLRQNRTPEEIARDNAEAQSDFDRARNQQDWMEWPS